MNEPKYENIGSEYVNKLADQIMQFAPPRKQLVQVMLPWFDPAGELFYSAMSFSDPNGKVGRRRAFRVIRKWYKDQIGVTVSKDTLMRIWKYRHSTFAMDESFIASKFHDMARESHDAVITESDTDPQEEANERTRKPLCDL